MKPLKILYLDPGHAFGLGNRTNTFMKDNFTMVDQYDFEDIELSPFACIVVHDFIDQEFMFRQKERILTFLNEGKIVIFAGHLCKEWLPGCPLFTPKTINSYKDYEISVVKPHPIFEGVDPNELTFNRGVAGFFARGSHSPVPEGAEVLLSLPENMPVTYIDRKTTKGTILAHAGRDLFAFRMDNKTTGRISRQLLDWIYDEYAGLQERGGEQ